MYRDNYKLQTAAEGGLKWSEGGMSDELFGRPSLSSPRPSLIGQTLQLFPDKSSNSKLELEIRMSYLNIYSLLSVSKLVSTYKDVLSISSRERPRLACGHKHVSQKGFSIFLFKHLFSLISYSPNLETITVMLHGPG
jgi:hypothetical protein